MTVLKEQFDQIDAKKAEYEEEEWPELDKMKLKLEETEAIANLRGHFAIKEFVDRLTTDVEEMNRQLVNKRDMTEKERETIFIKKDLYLAFLSIFTGAEELREKLNKQIASL